MKRLKKLGGEVLWLALVPSALLASIYADEILGAKEEMDYISTTGPATPPPAVLSASDRRSLVDAVVEELRKNDRAA